MHYFRKTKRIATALLLLGVNFSMSACSGLSSPIDQAYYTGGDQFITTGGYTRTIFSTSNF
jgi:hypothetical protein